MRKEGTGCYITAISTLPRKGQWFCHQRLRGCENAAGADFFGLLVLLMPFRLSLVEPSDYYQKFE
jgi:hypothetical protein